MIDSKRLFIFLDVIVICFILLFAFYIQIFWHEQPCPLCLLQRLGLIGIATGLVLNLRFGISSKHYAVALLSALFGIAVSIRQILLHIVPGTPAFGAPVFGLHLYTWSFIGYVAMLLYIGLLLFISERGEINHT